MQAFPLEEVQRAAAAAGGRYHEFLRVPAMSLGLYRLARGSEDPQRPHGEDEFYLVLEGRARFTSGGATRDVGPGDVLFVPAREEHRFHAIAEDLVLLVGFGPAEGTLTTG